MTTKHDMNRATEDPFTPFQASTSYNNNPSIFLNGSQLCVVSKIRKVKKTKRNITRATEDPFMLL